ncbi:UTRA domain-containing protein, partial [Vibrio cholerae O1]|nr:UTRA domain-containing protein [Vibrio cholerae O1]
EVASANVAKQLQIEPGSPILTIYRVTYDQNNIPREYMIKQYRADKYYLVMNLEN